VRLFITPHTQFIVQLEWIKAAFVRRYKVLPERVHVCSPTIEPPKATVDAINMPVDSDTLNLFYPAYAYPYKNHRLLNEALLRIDEMLPCKVALYLSNFSNFSNFSNVEIYAMGIIPYGKVLWLYRHVNALLFPSFIETFGLPLTEAASFGLPVLAADLPYAREVLAGYDGATFVNHQDAEAWGNAILSLCRNPAQRFASFAQQQIDGWGKFFEIVAQKISK
jgi:glycosyltransferase involved in cell wall biosynthesis